MKISSKPGKDPLTRLLQERADGSQLTNIVRFLERLPGKKREREKPHFILSVYYDPSNVCVYTYVWRKRMRLWDGGLALNLEGNNEEKGRCSS